MSLNLNKVVLAGRITADLELKQTGSGVSLLNFTIAVNRSYVSKSSEQGERQADFINVVAWRQTAEFIAKYFRKGSAICVTGSIQTRSWQDQQGQKRYATEVVADEAAFVESRGSESNGASYTPDAYAQTQSFTSNAGSFEDHNTDDDLPF
jgi:single-strand DNA-binding protein